MTLNSLDADVLPWLADMALQATLLLAIPGMALLLMPRMAAARRHLILAASLAGIPVLMLCTALWPAWRLVELNPEKRIGTEGAAAVRREQAEPAPKSTTEGAGYGAPQVVGLTEGPPPVTSTLGMQATPTPPDQPASSRVSMVILLVWLAGVFMGVCALGVMWMRLSWMRRRLTPESDPRLLSMFLRTLQEAGVQAETVTLLRGGPAHVPMTWGMLGRRFILLPCSAKRWSDARLLLVLRHEIGHISRHDVPVSLAAALCTLLLWFHPLAWWTLRACNAAREAACDDLALQRGDLPAATMAEELLAVVVDVGGGNRQRLFLPPALAMAAAGKAALKRRLTSLLNPHQRREGWSRRSAPGIIGIIIGSAVLLSGFSACREGKPAASAEAMPTKPAATAAKAPQVYIASKVFSVPSTTEVLDELGLSLPPSSELSNLGIMDADQARELTKKIAQIKGASLMSSPSVTTGSGQKATVEVVREFIYPVEFQPPQIPDPLAKSSLSLPQGATMPITPTTPTAFEMRPVGIRMELLPEVTDEGGIHFTVSPAVTSFSGFINYGTPIKGNTLGADGRVQQSTLSENIINQPVFHTAKLTTQVTLPSGHCLVMGGLGGPEDGQGKELSDTLEPDLNTQASMTGLRSNHSDRLFFFVIEAKVMVP